ncbi:hypothetical protein CMI37_08475 [Candidatus Pacearchaeota archaeon]|nr:hypothetical protein [Candidatus Pacearchaeota archaeon]|tara:strand:+ start:10641 stop:11069 length:429 start_codon:yes stop_codon:yes gene_type:complete
MGVEAGKDCVLKLDDSGDTQRTLTTYVTKVSMDLKGHGLVDVTAMSASGHTWASDELEDCTFSVDFLYDDGSNTVWDVLTGIRGYATARDWEIGPKGSTGGYPKLSGTCFLEGLPMEVSIGDVIRLPGVPFRVNGAVTIGTW